MAEIPSINSGFSKTVLGQSHSPDDVAHDLQDPLVRTALTPYYDSEPDAIAKPDLRCFSCVFRFVSSLCCDAPSRTFRFGTMFIVWCTTLAIAIIGIWGAVHGSTIGFDLNAGCARESRTIAQLIALCVTVFPASSMIVCALASKRSSLYQRTAVACVFLLWVAAALAAYSRTPYSYVLENLMNPDHFANLLYAASEVVANGLAIRRIAVLEASHGVERRSAYLFWILIAFTVIYAIGVIMAPLYPERQHEISSPVFVTLAIAVATMLLLWVSTIRVLNAQIRSLHELSSRTVGSKDDMSLASRKLQIESSAICTLFLTASMNVTSTWLFFSPLGVPSSGGRCLAEIRYILYALDGTMHALSIAVLTHMQQTRAILIGQRKDAKTEVALTTFGDSGDLIKKTTLDITV